VAQLSLRGIKKRFRTTDVLHGIDLEIGDREFVVFVGPSGCGKSTLLRLIAGLDPISEGEFFLNGQRMNDVAPSRRGIAMVFQSYALYPHMDVYENMAFGARLMGLDKAEVESRIAETARMLRLEPLMQRKPRELSGGQRQRVAIGRAIVREPKGFLFDEPLSNLDAALRVNMRLELSELHQQLKTTMIYVTHDQVEAMTMADKIVVLNRGNVEQVGSPLDLYENPKNLFVAGFIGSPKMNFFTGDYAKARGAVTVGVRPEHLTISKDSGDLRGTAGVSEHLGSDTFIHIRMDNGDQITARGLGDYRISHGDPVFLTPEPSRTHRFDSAGLTLGKA